MVSLSKMILILHSVLQMKFLVAALIYKLYAMNVISLLQIMMLCASVFRLCVFPNMTE